MIKPQHAPGTVVVYIPRRAAELVHLYADRMIEALQREDADAVAIESMMRTNMERMAKILGGEATANELAEVLGEIIIEIAQQHELNDLRRS